MIRKGRTWNESEVHTDPWTLRRVRRITRAGAFNQTQTYHTNTAFTADGEFLVFASERDGASAVFRCHVPTGDLTALTEPVPGKRVGGTSLCVAPRSRWVTYRAGRAVRAVHMDTLEERTLIEDLGAEWIAGVPSIDPEERWVLMATHLQHPEAAAGRKPSQSLFEYWAAHGGSRLRIVQVPLEGGEVEVVHDEEGCTSNHTPHSPADPDLLLIDRDFPPRYSAGSDGKTNRIWILRLSTRELTELPPRDRARFQVHSAWTWDGRHVLYHGKSAEGGHYIGVTDPNGNVSREYGFHDREHYGHVAAMAGRPAIILDGNLSPDLLLWLYYDGDRPRVEVIARHGTEWHSMPGQLAHPHPQSDPTGRWISFNAARGGRSDVFVVEV